MANPNLQEEKKPTMGKLVIIDGIDGCGKDTQADLLVDRMDYVKMRLPDYSKPSGKVLRGLVDSNKEGISEEYFQSLMLVNYIDVFENDIYPTLKAGKNVVMTRGWDSMEAYGRAFGVDYNFIDKIIKGFRRYIEDSLGINNKVIILDVMVYDALKRIAKRDKKGKQAKEDLFENKETLEKVRTTFIGFSNMNNVVRGDQGVERVYADVLSKIDEGVCDDGDDCFSVSMQKRANSILRNQF